MEPTTLELMIQGSPIFIATFIYIYYAFTTERKNMTKEDRLDAINKSRHPEDFLTK